MESMSIWHWVIVPPLLVGLFLLLVRRSRRRGGATPSARLADLAKLRQQGLITEAEYERKRSELAQQL